MKAAPRCVGVNAVAPDERAHYRRIDRDTLRIPRSANKIDRVGPHSRNGSGSIA